MRLSPLWQRRSALFWAHRRGRVSLFIFLGVTMLSLGGSFIANDKPLVLEYRGALYFPMVQRAPETQFGAEFLPTEADYTNPEVKAAINAHGWMLWPLIPYAAGSIVWNAGVAPACPDARDWLGTDDVSRDVLARVIYGVRLSLGFGFALTFAAAVLGIVAGAVQGFYGGLTDLLFQRATEIWSGIPQLFLLLLLSSLVLPGFFLLLLFMLAFSWMALAGLVRAEFLRLRNLDYVRAATALGVPRWRIMTRHMLPNALTATISFLPFILADSIALLASLDFLGLGMPPGAASLGQLIAQARDNPQAPWLGVTIFMILGGLLLLLIFTGEAVRESFDPHHAP